MKRIFTNGLFNLLSNYLDDSVPVEKIHDFMISHTKEFMAQIDAYGIKSFSPEVRDDLRNIYNIVRSVDLFKQKIEWTVKDLDFNYPPNKQKIRKLNGLNTQIFIHKGVLKKGAGEILNLLLDCDNKAEEILITNVEKIMRHIEIRRQSCLNRFDPEISVQERWLEKHNIGILFARYARKYNEYRVLNTVFKLNDWAFPHYQKKTDIRRLSKFLSALYEQEKAAEELTR